MSWFDKSAAELDAVLDTIPALATRPRTVEDLPGGLTNRNLKVTTPDGTFVVRCSDDATAAALGIDRAHEAHNTQAAAAAGVGAPYVAHAADLGLLVIGWVDAVALGDADFARPGVLERAADACRRLHAGPAFQGRFDMFALQPTYLRTVQERGYRIPDGYLDHADAFARMRSALAVADEGLVPCNNDLLAANFLDDGTRTWLIDYEYSGMNDPCFELGNVWSECSLDVDQLEALVTAYYGRPRRSRLARARLFGIAAKYGWTLWGCIQHASSPLDADFWAWGMQRWETAEAEFRGPDFERLLQDATLDDGPA